jgi:hypothetical protein
VTWYVLPGMSARDGKFLSVTSRNATTSGRDGGVSLLPTDNRPIVIEFNSTRYKTSLAITVAAWVAVIGFGILRVAVTMQTSPGVLKLRWFG